MENAVLAILNSPENLLRNNYKWAVKWENWSGKGPNATSPIDLVAVTTDGKKIAIQVKARREEYKASLDDVNGVVARANTEDWDEVRFYHTGGGMTAHVKELLEANGDRIKIYNRAAIARQCADWQLVFPGVNEKWPQRLKSGVKKHTLRSHQEEAVDDILERFSEGEERGQLIMPCGTGKTFVAQSIAERIVGKGGSVLVVVPSISLLSQCMREWASQQGKSVPHRYLGVCSDIKAGKVIDDEISIPIWELDFPVTTDKGKLADAMANRDDSRMLVVFSTYQSLDKVSAAQEKANLRFDLAMMDEAHRTTGLARTGITDKDETLFRAVHDPDFITANRRLYMTATPKVLVDSTSQKDLKLAEDGVFSMADENVFGKIFHELTFDKAIRQKLLTPYKVILLGVEDDETAKRLGQQIVAKRQDTEGKVVSVSAEEAAKIIGATRFAANFSPKGEKPPIPEGKPLTKMLAFTTTINESKTAAIGFDIADDIITDDGWEAHGMRTAGQHVDGTQRSDERDRRLEWLRQSEGDANEIRVLSNAKCLTEGVDIPSLDGVVFMAPKKSRVDVVQAVGRAIRLDENKDFGYIILPVLTPLPEGVDSAKALDKYITKEWKPAWEVLRALASHDERFRAVVTAMAAGYEQTGQLLASEGATKGLVNMAGTLPPEGDRDLDENISDTNFLIQGRLEEVATLSSRIFPVMVKQLGVKYDLHRAGEKAGELIARVRTAIWNARTSNKKADELLDGYHEKMKKTVGSPWLTKKQTDEMLAQHIVMEPVFAAFFGGSEFCTNNPVSQILETFLDDLRTVGFDMQDEAKQELDGFYQQVNFTVSQMTRPEQFQGYLKEVYSAFFRSAFKEASNDLGIAYTPTEIVDFINRSADQTSKRVFGKGIGDSNVGVMDPFTGTGIFLARMLADRELIGEDEVDNTYSKKLYAYELVLLAYYIASVNIEQAYHTRKGTDSRHYAKPFPGIVLHDTFEGFKTGEQLPGNDDNSLRALTIKTIDVEIIVGNPPYSNNKKAGLDGVKKAVRQEIAPLLTQGADPKSLQNSYIYALVWAENRLRKKGVISFILPAEWLRSSSGEGVRRWIENKFSEAWIVDLAGNAHSKGEARRLEGGGIFGDSCKSPIVILTLVQDSLSQSNCQIKYLRVRDTMTKNEKLNWLSVSKGIDQMEGWQILKCDEWGHWFGNRQDRFYEWLPVASKEKGEDAENAVFKTHSLGINTARDHLAFQSSREKMEQIARIAVEEYERHRKAGLKPASKKNEHIFKWHRDSKKKLERGIAVSLDDSKIRPVMYRPFFPQWAHWEPTFNAMHYRMRTVHPVRCRSQLYPPPPPHTQSDHCSPKSYPSFLYSPRLAHSRRYNPTSPIRIQIPTITIHDTVDASAATIPADYGMSGHTTQAPRWIWKSDSIRGRLRLYRRI